MLSAMIHYSSSRYFSFLLKEHHKYVYESSFESGKSNIEFLILVPSISFSLNNQLAVRHELARHIQLSAYQKKQP